MEKLKEAKVRSLGYPAATVAFLGSFGFFQFAYPYHLMRREQMSLFVFDCDYIRQTYTGTGWLVRLVSDFLEQFFHLPVAGPMVVALLLTGIAAITYLICRKAMGRGPSFAIAALMFAWSFMRETGNLYITRYTIVVLGYLALVLLALQLRNLWGKLAAVVLLLAFGAWALGSPVDPNHGKPWGVPRINYDKVIGLDDQVSREHWDKVLKISRKDLYMVEASYCYNLAQAMQGNMGNKFFDHSQGGPYDLLLLVSLNQSLFTNSLAGEAWYQLGSMTIAEQSAIISLQASPNHTGARYIKRLAQVNLASGEDAAAQKYLNLLSKTLFYGRWARSMMPGCQDEATKARLQEARSRLAYTDFVHLSDVPRSILLGLLEADPDNDLARNYLLCFDLVRYDLDQFMEDYSSYGVKASMYDEAIMIWLGQRNALSEQNAAEYGIDASMLKRLDSFFRMPDRYRNTYWYYYLEGQN